MHTRLFTAVNSSDEPPKGGSEPHPAPQSMGGLLPGRQQLPREGPGEPAVSDVCGVRPQGRQRLRGEKESVSGTRKKE